MPLSDPGRVDFYVLAGPKPAARLRFACRLAEKAYRLDHRVHLQTGSAAEAEQLDELLWTFRQGSFVPHELAPPGRQRALRLRSVMANRRPRRTC